MFVEIVILRTHVRVRAHMAASTDMSKKVEG